MTLRRKLGSGLLVIILIAIVVALSSTSGWLGFVDDWFEQYSEAVEAAKEDDDDDDNDDESESVDSMMVRVNDEIGEYAGVETSTLAMTAYFSEVKAQAKVVDIRPMLALRARHNQALAALNVAKVVERSAAQELTRLKSLAKGTSSVAAKKVNYAQATYNEANAKSRSLNVELQAVRDETLQSFGTEIATWVLDKESKQWQRLLSHQDSLLLVTLPVDNSLSAEVSVIRIARDSLGKQARKAYFVSPAFINEGGIQGETYFFKTANVKLRVGMQINAWLPQGNEPLNGVFIPNQAVVWNAGQAWVYIKLEEDLYQRRSLLAGQSTAGGIFISDEFSAGDDLVISGAQMLLSEEFRWQILDEDDD